MNCFRLSERKACRFLKVQRSTFRYVSTKDNDEQIRRRMKEIAQKKRRYGYRRIHILLKRENININHKKTERLYREEGLSIRKRKKKRLKSCPRLPLNRSMGINDIWTMDFLSDSLCSGRKFRTLNILDTFNRECLAIEVDTSIPGKRVTKVLDRIITYRGKPSTIVCDNGPEFTSVAFDQWAYENNVQLSFINPGKPVENAFIESFNGKFRDECLNENWFLNLNDARKIIESWRIDYNNYRPHSSLNNMTPVEFMHYGEPIAQIL